MSGSTSNWAATVTLARVQLRGVARTLPSLVALLVVGAIALGGPVRWDAATGTLRLGDAELSGFGEGPAAVAGYLGELLSWWWMTVAAVYLLPVVLMPLAASFARDRVLWLRLGPGSPRALAAARAGRALAAAALVGGPAVAAALALAAYHGVPAGPLVASAVGLPAHVLFSAGLLLVAGPRLSGGAGRTLAAVFAWLVPVASLVVYLTARPALGAAAARYWPFACPFAPEFAGAAHAPAAAVVGLALIVWSVAVRPGARTGRPGAVPSPIGVHPMKKSVIAPLILSLALGVSSPGCSAVGAALYKLLILIGTEVAKTAVVQFVVAKLDQTLFPTTRTSSHNGVVINPADSSRGYYDGTMTIAVRDEATGKEMTFTVTNPGMRRAATDGPWKLDRNIIDHAKERVKERLGVDESFDP